MADMTRTDYNWPILIAAYFIIQTLSRASFGSGLGLDEAEMMLTAQTLEWGYGPQPPLYSWIQHTGFALFGENIFALALVKNAFLCLTYLALYRLLRSHYDKHSAGLASLAVLLLPQIAWESQRALSHSVLSTAMVIITLAAFSRLNERRDIGSYLLFGTAIALGGLSKFNYLLMPVAILAAALTLPATRQSVLNPRLLLSFGVAAAILAKPIEWMISQQSKTLASVHKFKITLAGSRLQAALEGFLDLTLASVSFVALLIVVLVILYLRYRKQTESASDQPVLFQLMSRTVIAALLLTLVIVLASGTTNVKDRWLQPVLIFAAPTLVLWLLPRVSKLAWQRLSQVIFAAALLITLILPLHNIYGGKKKPSRRSAPFAELAAAINQKYPNAKTVFAQNKWVGGNLLHLNKNWQVAVVGNIPKTLKGEMVLVWQSENQKVPNQMLEELRKENRSIVSVDPATTLQLPYPTKPDVVLPAGFASILVK